MNLDELTGLLAPGVGDALHDLAGKVPADLAIVEIGSFRGKSSAYLAQGAKDGNGAQVHAVDPWDLDGNPYGKHGFSAPEVREDFERQLRACKLWSRVTVHQGFSTEVAAGWRGREIGLLFIDADHDESAVRADVEAWTPHLAERHIIAFDDYDTPRNPGVNVVVHQLAKSGYDLSVVADHLAVLR